MPYYTLHYTLSADYINKRSAFRKLHFEHLNPYFERGQLMQGGAYDDPSLGALLIFKVNDADIIHEFAQKDPYVINEVVTSWRVDKWNVAIGE